MAIVLLLIVAGTIVFTLALIIIKNFAAPKKTDAVKRLLKQGKNQQAIKIAKQILAKEPKNYMAHYYMGKAYMNDNRAELALMEFKYVNENALFGGELQEVPFRRELAQLYIKFNQPNEALRELLLLTKMDPNNPDVFYQAGKILSDAGKLEPALGFFRKCTKLNKRNAKAYAEIGIILFKAKQFKDAKRELDYAVALNPENYSCYYYQGRILKEEKDLPGAIKAFEKAQRDNELKQKALIERASCFLLVGRTENAQIDLQRAIDFDKENVKPETLHARYLLGNCYEKNRKLDKAIEQWEKIYSRNRGFRDVASKLQEYKALQANDNMKDYLTSSDADFTELCKKACLAGFKLNAHQVEITKYGAQVFATESSDENWRERRKELCIIRFYRNPEPVDEDAVRDAIDKTKSMNGLKSILISSSGFTRSAVSYTESRPVELAGKEKLERILAAAAN